MGLIRKTASISTLGLISFRSKRERLRRAETAQADAARDLLAEQAARAEADDRVRSAERRAKQAELLALHEAKVADRHKRGRRHDRHERGRRARKAAARRARHAEAGLRESLHGAVEAAQPHLEAGLRQARRRGRAARKQAGAVAKQAREQAKSTLGS